MAKLSPFKEKLVSLKNSRPYLSTKRFSNTYSLCQNSRFDLAGISTNLETMSFLFGSLDLATNHYMANGGLMQPFFQLILKMMFLESNQVLVLLGLNRPKEGQLLLDDKKLD